jgi:hypothetical protein
MVMTLLSLPVWAKEAVKLSLGQYRVVAPSNNYWYTTVSGYYATNDYKVKLTQPLVRHDNGGEGAGNATLKLSLLNQWQKMYVDLHLKQKLANARASVTLPVNDTSLSIEASGFLWGGIGFIELGYWWRQKTKFERTNSLYYSMGGVSSLKRLGFDKAWVAGLVMDHKPTSQGKLDRVVSLLLQRKLSPSYKVTATVGKGISEQSPDWITGLMWQKKY